MHEHLDLLSLWGDKSLIRQLPQGLSQRKLTDLPFVSCQHDPFSAE